MDFGLSDVLSCGEHDLDLCESLLFDAIDFGVPLLDLWEPDFSLRADPTLECLESDLAGDGLLELCLESAFSSIDGLLDLDDLPLTFEPTDGAIFSSSEFLSGVEFAALDGVPLWLDLEDPDWLSDSEPKRNLLIRYSWDSKKT